MLITFNARNDHDRQKFVEDLKEAILEVRDKSILAHKEYCIFCNRKILIFFYFLMKTFIVVLIGSVSMRRFL